MTKPAHVFSVCVIGAGLAGSECVYQLQKHQVDVLWLDMKPHKKSPAHHDEGLAELVCSNSFRSLDVLNAVGLIKEEMSSLDSVIMKSAYQARVPAGTALAVDRQVFSQAVKTVVCPHPSTTQHSAEVLDLLWHDETGCWQIVCSDQDPYWAEHVVVATGPLTAEALSQTIKKFVGEETLYFYDAIAPIVDFDSIDMTKAFLGSRYDKDQSDAGDYINCPMNEDEYNAFMTSLLHAELAPVKDFDKAQFFEGCLPVEVMASRGYDTLRYGPMKPIGIHNPHKPQDRPFAVVQLRQDNRHATLYNMVGFQTRMRYPDQQKTFRLIPGLEKAEFVRLGSMHRNTYLCSPRLLKEGLELKSHPQLHFAGQITGCEGYVESSAIGLYVGGYLAQKISRKSFLPPPPQSTALGALIHHILNGDPDMYQPMNVNFGLFSALPDGFVKKDRKTRLVQRAFSDFRAWYYDFWKL